VLLDQLKNPRDLASLLSIQRFKKGPDGTIPGTCLVELDGSHFLKVSIYANLVNANLKVNMIPHPQARKRVPWNIWHPACGGFSIPNTTEHNLTLLWCIDYASTKNFPLS
jgi:hypothetical protein